MKKRFFLVALCLALFLCFSSSASAVMINEWWGGDRVVRDTVNRLYWYPILTDFTGMTKDEQLIEIANMDYAGSTDWRMATYKETSRMKKSFAKMATEKVMPTDFADLTSPSYEDRHIGSPWEAWKVNPAEFFTSTGLGPMPMDFLGYPGYFADMYNGRTDGWGWTNMGPGGFGGDVVWNNVGSDDHFVVHGILQGDPNYRRTMLFNFDQHWRDDDALVGPGGTIGAWVVTKHVPEPSTMLFLGLGLIGIAAVTRRMKK